MYFTTEGVPLPLTRPRARPRQYQIGDKIGGVTVTKILHLDGRLTDRRYWVRYACCGRTGELTHLQLRQRASRDATTCSGCWSRNEDASRLPTELIQQRREARALAMSGAWRRPTGPQT